MKPIICNSESVIAILDGRKTQTRRVIKPQPVLYRDREWTYSKRGFHSHYSAMLANDPSFVGWLVDMKPPKDLINKCCPYGIPGDKLWVRETFWQLGEERHGIWYWTVEDDVFIKYLADNPEKPPSRWMDYKYKKRPSIHMPKWASRIILEINEVRVERVQDISMEDIVAEGLIETEFVSFAGLWDSINAKPKPVYMNKKVHHYISYPFDGEKETRIRRGKPWYILPNPWNWAITFGMI